MYECSRHGPYSGMECPTCSLESATYEAAAITAAATAEAAAIQAEEIRRAAEETLAAQYETQQAIESSIRENRRLAEDGWKLEVQSKVRRSVELLNAKLYADAGELLRSALQQDPGNLYGHLYLAVAEVAQERPLNYVLEMTKAIQLLGSPEHRSSDNYRHVMEWFTSDADDNLVRAIAEKVISLAERDAVQIDQDLLLEIADHGWTDLTKTVAPCILPAKCSWGLVKGLLERNCADAAWSAARRMVEAGGSAADVPMWLQGALSIWEVKHASGLGEPMNNV